MTTVTSVEAQNRFGQLLDTVLREQVSITRHERIEAFIVSSEVYQALTGDVAAHTGKMAAYLLSLRTFAVRARAAEQRACWLNARPMQRVKDESLAAGYLCTARTA